MQKILRYIKNNFGFLWDIIQIINSLLVMLLYRDKLETIDAGIKESGKAEDLKIYKITNRNSTQATDYLLSLNDNDIEYFRPFEFKFMGINKFLSCKSNLFYAVVNEQEIIAVFFIRFFCNKQAFLGFLVDSKYRGKGLGTKLISIIACNCKFAGFPLFSSISVNNPASVKAHLHNGFIKCKDISKEYSLYRAQ